MWRPFASEVVSHTFESFHKKHEKAWVPKPIKLKTDAKFDPSDLFPYSIAEEELSMRHQEFFALKAKVSDQRKSIKAKESELQNKKILKANLLKNQMVACRKKQKNYLIRIRSMASSKVCRHRSAHSQDYPTENLNMTSERTKSRKTNLQYSSFEIRSK